MSSASVVKEMFKISIVETDGQRRLVLAGKLVPPWTTELERAWQSAAEELRGRKLVVDLTDVTVISPDGENTLFKLMKNGAKFSCMGVLTRHVLKQLTRRCQCRPRGVSGQGQLEGENINTEA